MNYRYLAVDFGDSNVGLSVSNGLLTRPLPVFKYPKCDYHKLRRHLIKVINFNKIVYVIVGIPLNDKSSSKIKEIFLSIIFKENFLKEKVIWINEDDSTSEALKFKARRRMKEDSISASIILDRFLLKKKWSNDMNEFDSTKKITEKDFIFLKKRVDELEKSRQGIVEKRRFVDGDRSENADWIVLTQEFEIISREIDRLRKAISEISEVISDQETKKDFVDIGSKVTYEIINETNPTTHEIEITHEIMTDPFNNKVSCKSPLGTSLRLRRVGDVLELPNLNYKIKILEIK